LKERQTYRNTQNVDNRGNFRRPIMFLRFFQEIPEAGKGMIKNPNPFPKQPCYDEDEEDEENDPEIHCLGDTPSSPHLTQSAYGKSLMR
jgi:hypothetical protein